MFIPCFMATYWHAMPLLAVPKAQKASLIIGTSENARVLESIGVNGEDKKLAD